MSILIRDETMATELAAADGPQELRTSDGRLLGRFVPAAQDDIFPEFGVKYGELLQEIQDPHTEWHAPDEVMARLREIDRCSP
jgi:hypothetical protein